MRNFSTGILFSCIKYIRYNLYNLILYGFQIPDRLDYAKTCQFRHFISYLSKNFSAWILTTNNNLIINKKKHIFLILISSNRSVHLQFALKAQWLCTPRTAIYSITIALIFDCLLHVHLLTPMFGQIAPGFTTTYGANILYPTYSYFYTEFWPIITISGPPEGNCHT